MCTTHVHVHAHVRVHVHVHVQGRASRLRCQEEIANAHGVPRPVEDDAASLGMPLVAGQAHVILLPCQTGHVRVAVRGAAKVVEPGLRPDLVLGAGPVREPRRAGGRPPHRILELERRDEASRRIAQRHDKAARAAVVETGRQVRVQVVRQLRGDRFHHLVERRAACGGVCQVDALCDVIRFVQGSRM